MKEVVPRQVEGENAPKVDCPKSEWTGSGASACRPCQSPGFDHGSGFTVRGFGVGIEGLELRAHGLGVKDDPLIYRGTSLAKQMQPPRILPYTYA